MSVRVAVCIVGFRNPDDIAACLEALAGSTYEDFQVVICENGGEPAYRALVERLPATLPGGQPVAIHLAPGNLGYAGGVNVCIRNSPDADAWWVLNPDALPEPQALGALVAKLAEGSCEIVGGIMYYSGGVVESYGGRWRRWLARSESIGHGRSLDQEIDLGKVASQLTYIPGGSMLAGRRFVATVGLMPEDYFLYCEEVAWSLRGQELGMRLGFAPEARVLHNQGTTTGSGLSIKRRPKLPIYLDERNKMLLSRDYFAWGMPISALAAFALIFLRYARKAAWSQLGYALQGWAAGLLNRRGVPAWLNAEKARP